MALVLLGVIMFFRPVSAATNLYDLLPKLEASYWAGLADRPVLEGLVLAMCVCTVVFSVGTWVTSILFFKKRASFPMVFLALYGAQGAFILGSAYALELLGEVPVRPLEQLFGQQAIILLFMAYVATSARVKEVFVNGVHAPRRGQLLSSSERWERLKGAA